MKNNGLIAQLVRALACHARGRGFEPLSGRHYFINGYFFYFNNAYLAQLVEQGTENPCVRGSIPRVGTKNSSECYYFFSGSLSIVGVE